MYKYSVFGIRACIRSKSSIICKLLNLKHTQNKLTNCKPRFSTGFHTGVMISYKNRGGSRANLKGGQLMMGALTNFQNFVIRVLTIMSLCTIMSDPTDGISAICVRRRAFRAIVLQE